MIALRGAIHVACFHHSCFVSGSYRCLTKTWMNGNTPHLFLRRGCGLESARKKFATVNYRFYKYIGHEYWFENLQECKFNVTKPSEFNDPFDCTGVIREPWNDDAKAQFHDRETFLGKMNDRTWADEFYRVLCLTDAQLCDAASEALFWSHYANWGKGIRVTLEVGDGTFIPTGNVRCVRYCHAKPVLDMEHYKKGSLDLYNYLSDCMTTKGISWGYEHEVRVIFEKEKTFLDAAVVGKDIRFVHIQRSCVKEITFGPMFNDDESRNFAHKLIPVFGDSSIFYKAVREDVYYRYNYYPLFDNRIVKGEEK